jgi:hypothetical protein
MLHTFPVGRRARRGRRGYSARAAGIASKVEEEQERGQSPNPLRERLRGRTEALVAEGVRRIGGKSMGENPDHDREEVPGRPAVSSENTREQAQEGRERRAEEGRGDPATRLRLFVRRLFGRR